MLRSILFFFAIFSSSLIISPANTLQASPREAGSQQTEQRVTTPDNQEAESKEQEEEKKTSLYANLTQQQLNQIKRYDCRLPKEIIPHNYLKKTASNKKNHLSAEAEHTKKRETSRSKS